MDRKSPMPRNLLIKTSMDSAVEKEKTQAMLIALQEIVNEELKNSKLYNIDEKTLRFILQRNAEKFPGITDPNELVRLLAQGIRHLRQKLGLPENPKKGY